MRNTTFFRNVPALNLHQTRDTCGNITYFLCGERIIKNTSLCYAPVYPNSHPPHPPIHPVVPPPVDPALIFLSRQSFIIYRKHAVCSHVLLIYRCLDIKLQHMVANYLINTYSEIFKYRKMIP